MMVGNVIGVACQKCVLKVRKMLRVVELKKEYPLVQSLETAKPSVLMKIIIFLSLEEVGLESAQLISL